MCLLTDQEPAYPDTPAHELAEPNYFTAPSLLAAELLKIDEATASARLELQVRNPAPRS